MLGIKFKDLFQILRTEGLQESYNVISNSIFIYFLCFINFLGRNGSDACVLFSFTMVFDEFSERESSCCIRGKKFITDKLQIYTFLDI